MAADRPRRNQDVDDWFAEPGPPTSQKTAPSGPSRDVFDAQAVESQVPSADDWLRRDETARARRPRFVAAELSTGQKAVAAGVLVLVLLMAGLAAAGVFSGGSRARTSSTPTLPRTVTPPQSTPTPVQTPAPTTTLKSGDQGLQVKALQRALASLGYPLARIDGQYGPATQRALAHFQQTHNVTADGVLGPATLAALTHALKNRG